MHLTILYLLIFNDIEVVDIQSKIYKATQLMNIKAHLLNVSEGFLVKLFTVELAPRGRGWVPRGHPVPDILEDF